MAIIKEASMSIDLYQLRTFFEFGKIRNFTRTAKRLYISQSAVSHALKKLEKSVGKKLVVRRGGEYFLSEAGEMLFKTCKRIFFEIDRFQEEITVEDSRYKQKIYLGAPVEFGTTFLIRNMSGFLQRYPHIHVNFLFSHHLEGPLMRDELDLIVDCKAHHHTSLDTIFLSRERYVVTAAPDYVRTNHIKTAKDLEKVRILSLDEKGEWWNNFLLPLPIENRPVFNNIMRLNHVRALINGAIEGMGVSFVPRYTVDNELKQGILYDVFPENRSMDDHFRIYISKERRELKKNRLMIDFLCERFSGFAD
jgi:DNA-binding transcriptional LysR family regulator